MNAGVLFKALEFVRGSVSSELDVVEIRNGWLRTTNGTWFSGINLGSELEGLNMVVPFGKMRSIAKTLDPDSEVILSQKGSSCRIKHDAAAWKLNVREVELEKAPAVDGEEKVTAGYDLTTAIRALKHIIRTDLSRPSLLVAWANEEGYLVIGDGSRLGGRECGIQDAQIPVMVAAELGRILGVDVEETVSWISDEDNLKIEIGEGYFISKTVTDSFEREWHDRVRAEVESAKGELIAPRSELKRAIAQVSVTAGAKTVKLRMMDDTLCLETRDEHKQKSLSRLPIDGSFEGDVILDISHLLDAVDSGSDETATMKIGKKVVEFSDEGGWEVLARKARTW